MTDTGQPPKRAFEPPPWERKQFEELARRRAEEQRFDAVLDELLVPPAVEPEPEPEPEQAPAVPGAPVAAPPEATAPAKPAVDEKQVAAMLLRLSGEEKPALHSVKRASRVVAVLVMLVGTAIIVIAALVATRSGSGNQLGAMSGLVGAVIGAAIAGVGAWLWIRSKR